MSDSAALMFGENSLQRHAKPPLVCVMLSTFNGARYVRDLLDSLLRQKLCILRILIRDDGSTDLTLSILDSYARNHKNIDLLVGNNIGVNTSFFELLRLAPDEAEFFAFCDQDDVWDADKVVRAVRMLPDAGKVLPGMYCSRVRLVDESLEVCAFSPLASRGPSFENALVENIAPGCTILLNKPARRLLISRLPNVENIVSYDWWTYLVLAALGHVIYDGQATLEYRQHATNVFGASTGIERWWRRLVRFKESAYHLRVFDQAKELLLVFGDSLPAYRRAVLEDFLTAIKSPGVLQRVRYAAGSGVYRQSVIDNILFKVLVCMGKA